VSDEKSIYDVEMPVIVPGVYGNCSIEESEDSGAYVLRYRGIQWMATDKEFVSAKDLLYSQFELAYGDVLITGLGFGILAKALAQKESVKSVTVLELNKEVIYAFLGSNEPDPKITLIEADASTFESETKYDCLLPDHYELQGVDWSLNDMRDMQKRIKHDVYWPWGIEELFFVKMYPRARYSLSSKMLFETYKEEIPVKWREFVQEHLDNHPTLADISEEKLVEYLKKHAAHHYDNKTQKSDWSF
jgi:hypothetical protein